MMPECPLTHTTAMTCASITTTAMACASGTTTAMACATDATSVLVSKRKRMPRLDKEVIVQAAMFLQHL